jgi:hypothetical protein
MFLLSAPDATFSRPRNKSSSHSGKEFWRVSISIRRPIVDILKVPLPQCTDAEYLNSLGDLVTKPRYVENKSLRPRKDDPGADTQAKIESSGVLLMISSCSRRNALSLSLLITWAYERQKYLKDYKRYLRYDSLFVWPPRTFLSYRCAA